MTIDKFILWSGIALALWIIYQAITGRFVYYRMGGFRREDNPVLFWGLLAFEGVFAAACLGVALGLKWLGMGAFGLFVVMDIGYITWYIAKTIRKICKYPRICRLFMADKPQEGTLELQSYVAAHPGNREALFMLADAYDKIGDQVAAWDTYTELARGQDTWARQAQAFLRKAQPNQQLY